ncbi:manganese efflux pump MntP [Desulfolucanica intricata]|uniref:manganese efflux pump MntP n=1 Tax=Desulfolucanica intricata TaxID=1285191 RepID=UPI0008360819|nr:manganese efflux pump MntP family protein [Desulfolucanica intricata]
MSLVTVLLLAVALGTDAFSMCIGVGMAGVRRKQILIITLTVLVFHIIMPVIGWYAGGYFGKLLGRAAAIVGALLLVYLGGRMLRGAWRGGTEEESRAMVANTWGLFVLSASVSMDALSVGFTLGTRSVNLIQVAGITGLVAGIMTFAGLVLGRFIGNWVGSRAQLAGGLILIVIGIKLFWG